MAAPVYFAPPALAYPNRNPSRRCPRPAGATVVGIPGRITEESAKKKDKEQCATYGVVPDQEDPYAKTLQSLVDHAQELEQTVSALTEKMRRLEQANERAKSDPLRAIK